MLENRALGFSVAFSAEALLYCALGVFPGTFIDVLPGVSVMAGRAMLMPLTFQLDVINGLIMLAGIYFGAAYGGSTASILLSTPGTPRPRLQRWKATDDKEGTGRHCAVFDHDRFILRQLFPPAFAGLSRLILWILHASSARRNISRS